MTPAEIFVVVDPIVRRYAARMPWWKREDTQQELRLYILEHLSTFDPSRGEITTWARWQCRSKITHLAKHYTTQKRTAEMVFVDDAKECFAPTQIACSQAAATMARWDHVHALSETIAASYEVAPKSVVDDAVRTVRESVEVGIAELSRRRNVSDKTIQKQVAVAAQRLREANWPKRAVAQRLVALKRAKETQTSCTTDA